MRKVMMIMYMTLDGIAEFPQYGDSPDDLEEGGDPMWTPRMAGIDTLLLGARAYKKWSAYWPTRKDNPAASPWEREYSLFANRAEKVVFSKTLQEAEWQNSRICRRDPAGEVARLKALPGKDIALGGGPRLAQSFLEHELVDEMLLTIFPSIVGSGKPMFRMNLDPESPGDEVLAGAPGRHDFRLVESRPRGNGALFVHFERKSQPSVGNPVFREA